MPVPPGLLRLGLRGVAAWDRARLAWLHQRHPGLQIDSGASLGFATARYQLGLTARLTIAPGAATERRPGWLNFLIYDGGEIVIGEDAWLRTEVAPVTLVAYPGAKMVLKEGAFVNGGHLSAKSEVVLEKKAQVGPGAKVYDADQHDLDDERPERAAAVRIGEYAWVASDATVLRGVTIGGHAVIGTRSVVNRDVPPHEFWAGSPARRLGTVGDRTNAR